MAGPPHASQLRPASSVPDYSPVPTTAPLVRNALDTHAGTQHSESPVKKIVVSQPVALWPGSVPLPAAARASAAASPASASGNASAAAALTYSSITADLRTRLLDRSGHANAGDLRAASSSTSGRPPGGSPASSIPAAPTAAAAAAAAAVGGMPVVTGAKAPSDVETKLRQALQAAAAVVY